MNKIVIALSFFFSSGFALAASNTDFCDAAINNPDILSVIKIKTNKNSIFSSTLYESKDGVNYTEKFSVVGPDVISSTGGLCAVLPKGEISPGLQILRLKLCITENNCQTVFISLKQDPSGTYTKATPHYLEIVE